MRNAIVGSKYGNCLAFDSDSVGSVFSLKWSRRRSPVIEEADLDAEGQSRITDLMFQLDSANLTFYQEEILGYIAGHYVEICWLVTCLLFCSCVTQFS